MLRAATFTLALLCSGSAMAQQAFVSLEACRLDPTHVALTAAYLGGACERPLRAEVAELRGTIAAVTIASETTSEICTRQLVLITARDVMEVSEPVVDLDVTALSPANYPVAQGVVPISETGPCEPPPVEPITK